MADVTRSECINHPGKPAANLCKQCGAAICHNCTVAGPAGKFCSDECQVAHRARLQGASQQATYTPPTFFVRLRGLMVKFLVLAAILFAAGVAGSVFDVPVLTRLTFAVRGFLGI